MDPLLLDLPEEITTERLVLRPPRAGDGAAMNEAIIESIEGLQRWMPWSTPTPTPDQSESWCRKAGAEFLARRQLPMLMFLRADGSFVGSSGMHAVSWDVPRFEIGYWVRRRLEGQGFVTEAAAGLTRFAFDRLGAKRVEIRADDRNERSWRVPERLGYRLEGILRNECRDAHGLRDTRVYAVVEAI